MLIMSFALVGVMVLTIVAYMITSRPLSELKTQELQQMKPLSAEPTTNAAGDHHHHRLTPTEPHLELTNQPDKVAHQDTPANIGAGHPSHFQDSFTHETTQMLENNPPSSSEPSINGSDNAPRELN